MLAPSTSLLRNPDHVLEDGGQRSVEKIAGRVMAPAPPVCSFHQGNDTGGWTSTDVAYLESHLKVRSWREIMS